MKSRAPTESLRKRAEKKAGRKRNTTKEALPAERAEDVLHELQVHQIELEMQNEELRRTQKELEASRARYFDLYDMAPVGYITLNKNGLILEANLTAANLLGTKRGALVRRSLTHFVLFADAEIFHTHRKQLFATGQPQQFELRLVKQDCSEIWARLEATRAIGARDCHVCRIVISEITEQKRAEQLLVENQQQLRALVEQAPLSVAMFDLDMNYIATSRRWADTYGAGFEELKGLNHYDVKPDMPEYWRKVHRLALAGQPQECEEELWVRANGKEHWLRWAVYPWRDASHNIGGVIISTEDITLRKQAEKTLQRAHIELELLVRERTEELQEKNSALAAETLGHLHTLQAYKESEGRFRLLAENSTDLICRFSVDGVFLYASPACRTLLGYEPGELMGHSAKDFLHPDEIADLAPSHAILLEGHETVTTRARVRRKDGSYVWFETSSRGIRDSQSNEVLEIQTCSRDITKRKRFEDALRESEESIRTLGNNLPNGAVFQFLRKADGLGLYSYVSEGLKRLMDVPSNQELGDPGLLESYVHPDDRDRLLSTRAAAAKQFVIFNFEGRIFTFEGEVKWMHCRAAPRRLANGDTIWDGVITDITQHKIDEEALTLANRALLALKKCDEALIRATSETELLNTVCHLLVETHETRMAWVGFPENDLRKNVRPVASAGDDTGYLKRARITWADDLHGRGPTGTSIRTGEVSICRDIASDPRMKPWRRRQLKSCFTTSIALPLQFESRCIGALTIYSSKTDAFSNTEVELLKQLAGDLAFGLVALRTRAERERLELELLKISEREKEVIAQEMHDGLCQHLTGTAFMGSVLHRQLLATGYPEAEQAKQICDLLNIGATEARNLSHGLHPINMEAGGLMDALATLAQTVRKMFHVPCTFVCKRPVIIENQDTATHLFRIAQESLNNAMKHGMATELRVELKQDQEGITLSIRDNGIGIPRAQSTSPGMGRHIMNHRARVIGGSLTIRRASKRGTLVRCTLPVDSDNKAN